MAASVDGTDGRCVRTNKRHIVMSVAKMQTREEIDRFESDIGQAFSQTEDFNRQPVTLAGSAAQV